MLEADPALLVAQRQQKIIMIEVLRPEQRRRLADKTSVRGDLRFGREKQIGAIGDDIERHRPRRGVERHPADIAPGEDR